MKTLAYLLLVVIAAIVSVTFTALNPGEITVNLYYGKFVVSLSVVVIVSAFFGILLGMLANTLALYGRRREIKRLRKQLGIAELEVSNLRKMPLRDH
ncbi:MAG: lipopolysaccharide assembly protein LapA domain-containing protein [Thiotrichales bacterium]